MSKHKALWKSFCEPTTLFPPNWWCLSIGSLFWLILQIATRKRRNWENRWSLLPNYPHSRSFKS
jgi:hypothetical protein